jgi:hypothetical protein
MEKNPLTKGFFMFDFEELKAKYAAAQKAATEAYKNFSNHLTYLSGEIISNENTGSNARLSKYAADPSEDNHQAYVAALAKRHAGEAKLEVLRSARDAASAVVAAIEKVYVPVLALRNNAKLLGKQNIDPKEVLENV